MTSLGVPWYTREEYHDALCIMEDAPDEVLPYEDWVIMAEDRLKSLDLREFKICRVAINAVEFSEWCFKYGTKLDAQNRSRFAMWKVACEEAGGHVEPKF